MTKTELVELLVSTLDITASHADEFLIEAWDRGLIVPDPTGRGRLKWAKTAYSTTPDGVESVDVRALYTNIFNWR